MIPPFKIGGLENHAAFGTHRAGGADADGIDLFDREPGFFNQFFSNFYRTRKRGLRIVCVGGKPLVDGNVSGLIADANGDFGSANIYS